MRRVLQGQLTTAGGLMQPHEPLLPGPGSRAQQQPTSSLVGKSSVGLMPVGVGFSGRSQWLLQASQQERAGLVG